MSDFLDRTDYVEPDEDEEEVIEPKRRGRPRPPEFVPDNFNSTFRGTRQPKHGGAQSVTEADTLGEITYCWCGQEYPHDWPGKANGRKHPRKETTVARTTVEAPDETDTIDRSHLRGYHRSVQDFVIHEVNVNGLRHRIAKNSILLYPLDGTAPASVFARNNDSQIRSLAQWHAKHVKPVLDLREDAEKAAVDRASLEALAAQVNDPVEHPAPQPVEVPVQAVEEAPVETPVAVPSVRQAPSHEGWTDPLSFEIDYKQVPSRYGAPRGWVWYTGSSGDIIEAIATNGTEYVCLYCARTDHPWRSNKAIGIGGHRRWRHSPDTGHQLIPDQDAKERSVLSRGLNKQGKIETKKAIDILCAAVRYYPRDPNKPEVARRPKGVPQADYDKVVTERDDALARIALMQEAFRGL